MKKAPTECRYLSLLLHAALLAGIDLGLQRCGIRRVVSRRPLLADGRSMNFSPCLMSGPDRRVRRNGRALEEPSRIVDALARMSVRCALNTMRLLNVLSRRFRRDFFVASRFLTHLGHAVATEPA
jgi:hypothetical protein